MKVADCVYNVKEIIAMIETASNKDVDLLGFSGTLHNRLHMLGFVFATSLLTAAEKGLEAIAEETKDKDTVVVVGLP